MNLAEFKHSVDFIYSSLRNYEKPEDINVVLEIDEPSVGAGACVNVTYISRGIDWESGRVNVCVSEKIVRKGHSKEDVIAPWEHEYDYGNGKKTTIRDCRMCGGLIKKDDRYCIHCGQRLRQ
jgi:hypothetical protein